MSSKEFAEWVAFDAYESLSTRTTPELLAVLIAIQANQWKAKGERLLLPQDILPDPAAPRRLSPGEEARRTGQVMADYRRLRAERLAKAEQAAKMDPSAAQVH